MRDKRRLRGGFTVLDWKLPTRDPQTGILEKHLPFANYIGPGTRIKWRLAQGIKPTTITDAAAKQHDIDYTNIGVKVKKGLIGPAQARQMVRASDAKLIAAANRVGSTYGPIERMHAKATRTGIGLKNIAEDLGALSEMKFIDPSHAEDEEIQGSGKRKKKAKKKDDRVKKLRKIFKKSSI